MDEQQVWKGSPSHILNFGSYFIALVVLAVLVALWILFGKSIASAGTIVLVLAIAVTATPVLFIFYKWLWLKSFVFSVTTERIKATTGILSKKTSVLELYRVKDYTLTEPFFYRLFRLGNIEIITSDPSNPRFSIMAVRSVHKLLDDLRVNVEACRQKKGARQLDVDQMDNDHPGQQ